MKSARIITKYPNRRLYDTEESRYVTLADIRRLVTDRVDFMVRDRKSGEDITRSILLQVITEQEQQGESIMSQDFPLPGNPVIRQGRSRVRIGLSRGKHGILHDPAEKPAQADLQSGRARSFCSGCRYGTEELRSLEAVAGGGC